MIIYTNKKALYEHLGISWKKLDRMIDKLEGIEPAYNQHGKLMGYTLN